MAIVTYTEFMDRSKEIISIPFLCSLVSGLVPQNGWVAHGGAVPTSAANPTDATVGALGQLINVPITEDMYVIGVEGLITSISSFALIDRLSHQGSLDATTTSEQTTNLPLGSGISRYSTATDKIQAAVQVYTAIGATATTTTIRYTNQAGVGSRVSQPFVIGGTGFNTAGRWLPICLQDTDAGVQTVEGLTHAASTGTAGNIGLVLYKTLLQGQMKVVGMNPFGANNHNLYTANMDFPIAKAGACLNLVFRNQNSAAIRGNINLMRV